MRRYFTRRCIALHLTLLILVPGCLYAGWWQYSVATSGNGLSWVYTVEWPFFAVYGSYMWWKLIHDQSTPFDRLWAAKQRAAADASGRPLHEIPGWALDKQLSRAVFRASIEGARAPALAPQRRMDALESAEMSAGNGRREAVERSAAESSPIEGRMDPDRAPHTGAVIDAEVIDVKVVENEELNALYAYNAYLGKLSWMDPPKRWGSRRSRRDPPENGDAPVSPTERQRPGLTDGSDT
ncbi:MAG: hypothetical protein ACRDVW_12070 [Acidimicrobiales bacterium]